MIKRNNIFVILILLFSLLVISCTNEDNEIGKLVEKAEILESKVSCSKMDYNEYKKEIKSIYSSEYIEEKQPGKIFGDGVDTTDCKIVVKISKVYDFTEDMKIVFSLKEFKHNVTSDEKPLFIAKKYYISKELNNWIITGDERMYYTEEQNIDYKEKYNIEISNNEIEYIKTINPLKTK